MKLTHFEVFALNYFVVLRIGELLHGNVLHRLASLLETPEADWVEHLILHLA